MTAPALTRDSAADLAAFLHRLRPEWQIAGIMAALHAATVRHPEANAASVAVAAARAAANPNIRTPAAIANDGPHWLSTLPTPRPARTDRASICSVCSLPEERCRALWQDDHEFLSVVQARRAARIANHPDDAHPDEVTDRRYLEALAATYPRLPQTTEEKIAEADSRRPTGPYLAPYDATGRPINDVPLPGDDVPPVGHQGRRIGPLP